MENPTNIFKETDNFTSYNVTSIPTLDSIQYDLFIEDIGSFIFLALIGTFGGISNLHVIFVYFLRVKQSNHRTMILFLAGLDFCVDVIVIPLGLYHIRYQLTAVNFICTMFIPGFLYGSSSLSLLVIAIDRYRKVCTPFKRQFAIKKIKLTCIVILITSFLFNLPTLFFYGAKKYYSEEFRLNISICSVMVHGDRVIVGLAVYLTIYLTLTLVLAVSGVACYTAIGCFVMTRKNKSDFLKKTASNDGTLRTVIKDNHTAVETTIETELGENNKTGEQNNRPNLENAGTTLEEKNFNVLIEKTKEECDVREKNNMKESSQCSKQSDDIISVVDVHLATLKNKGTCKKYNRSLHLTLMFLIATILHYICLLISVIFVSLETDTKTHSKLQDNLGPNYWIFRKFANVGTIINPIVFGVFDPIFRQTCLAFYTSLIKRICCTNKQS